MRAIYDTMPAFADIIRGLLSESIPANLERRYQEAVDELADVSPVLAYRLAGKPEITAVVKTWNSRINESLGHLAATEQDKAIVGKFAPHLENEARADLLKELEKDINEVAAKLSRRTLRETRQALSRAKARVSADREDEIATMLNKVLVEVGMPLNAAS